MTLTTLEAVGEALRQQRSALLRGDATALRVALERLASLVADARGPNNRQAASVSCTRAMLESTTTGASPGERRALREAAREIRELAQSNAQLLVRARDLTRRLVASLEQAAPALDREV